MKTETKKQPEKKDIGYYNTIPKKETLKEVAEKFAHGVVGVIVKHDDMTSTEYLEELIECGADLDLIKKAIPKAKEMEKKQIVKAWENGKKSTQCKAHICQMKTGLGYYHKTK